MSTYEDRLSGVEFRRRANDREKRAKEISCVRSTPCRRHPNPARNLVLIFIDCLKKKRSKKKERKVEKERKEVERKRESRECMSYETTRAFRQEEEEEGGGEEQNSLLSEEGGFLGKIISYTITWLSSPPPPPIPLETYAYLHGERERSIKKHFVSPTVCPHLYRY